MANDSLSNATTATAGNIYNAASVDEIRATLAELGAREAHVTARLDDLLASQKDLNRQLGDIPISSPPVYSSPAPPSLSGTATCRFVHTDGADKT